MEERSFTQAAGIGGCSSGWKNLANKSSLWDRYLGMTAAMTQNLSQ